ncbi:uncharacterized protein [Ptychodera flava]|uniref:uncharacterized protein n=1 Tax=Ptychodera flava TaxID=63121 RepID=UPI00396A097A
MTGKVSVVIDEIERQSRQLDLEERRMTLKERKVNLILRKHLLKLVEKVLNSVPGKDIAKKKECKEVLREFRAILNETKSGSLVFVLSFLTEEDIDYFWQKYKDGMVEKALSRILIPPSIADKALKAGITISIKLEIHEKEYEEVKDKMHGKLQVK